MTEIQSAKTDPDLSLPEVSTPTVFVSYRTADTSDIANRLSQRYRQKWRPLPYLLGTMGWTATAATLNRRRP